MRVLLSGSSGLIGSALAEAFQARGDELVRLVRRTSRNPRREIFWDPARGDLAVEALEGFEAVIHLAGENLAAGRWTAERKARIRESRVLGTRLLAGRLASLRSAPRALLCASAIGIYGHRGNETLTESSSPGSGFLASVCQAWETATAPAASNGIRVVNLRLGIVLTPRGGALGKMLMPFKLGLGGVIGRGTQWWSWIALEDAVAAMIHALQTESLSGPVNVVSSNPVTNREFTLILGEALRRPTFLPLPELLARLLFGEMAGETVLASQRVEPVKLRQSGFAFTGHSLRETLQRMLAHG